MKESRKVYGWRARDRNAAVGRSSMWADTMEGECYCGNLLWQSSLTLLFPVTNRMPWRSSYDQRFELEADGTTRIRKFDYVLQQGTNLEFQVMEEAR